MKWWRFCLRLNLLHEHSRYEKVAFGSYGQLGKRSICIYKYFKCYNDLTLNTGLWVLIQYEGSKIKKKVQLSHEPANNIFHIKRHILDEHYINKSNNFNLKMYLWNLKTIIKTQISSIIWENIVELSISFHSCWFCYFNWSNY